MSQRSFGFGNRQSLMDAYSCERAAPRVSTQNEMCYRHPVIPISTASTPTYAQVRKINDFEENPRASQLYPMRISSERDGLYKYKPGGSLGNTGQTNINIISTATPKNTEPGQAISIPVLHFSQPRSTLSQTTNFGTSHASTGTPKPSSPVSSFSDAGDLVYRSSSNRSTPIATSPREVAGGRTSTNEQEAEIDVLTNRLLQSMETKSSAGGSIGVTSSVDGNNTATGTYRRGSGSNLSLGYNSQIGRLQQHLGLSSSANTATNVNGGRGSPLTVGGSVSASSLAGSSSTNSPTGSTTSIHNPPEANSTSGTLVSPTVSQNTCYRCHRALTPPEGSTLNPSTANNNVVTVSGALTARLHVACFTCYRCAAPLRTDGYYHSRRRLLCPACVRDGAVENCSNCRRPIGDRVVHALGLPYHPNCFVCVACGSKLDCRPFTIDIHGRFHCLDDFHRRYAPRCAHCGRPIAPNAGSQEATRVVSGDSNYHLECYGMQASSPTSTTNFKKTLVA